MINKKIIIFIIFGIFFISSKVSAFSDNFDSYTNATAINEQGGWIDTSNITKVSNDVSNSSPNSLKFVFPGGWNSTSQNISDNINDDFELDFKINIVCNNTTDNFRINTSTSGGDSLLIYFNCTSTTVFRVRYNLNGTVTTFAENLAENTWHNIKLKDGLTEKQVILNSLDPIVWLKDRTADVNRISFVRNSGTGNNIVYIDDISTTMVAEETCFDGIQNQNETGIDTGGVCSTITRVYHNAPEQDSITTSVVIDVVYTYYVNSITDGNFEYIKTTLCPRSYAYEDCREFAVYIGGYDELREDTITVTLNTGVLGLYEAYIQLWDGVENKQCAWYQILCKQTTATYGTGDFWSFSVVEESGTGTTPPIIDEDIFYKPDSPSSCAIATFDGMDCLLEVADVAFVPKDDVFDNFIELKDEVSKKAPFGWIVGTYTTLTNLNDNESAIFILESTTGVNDNIFAPIRTGLTWILYFAFLFVMFHRFKNMNI